jgi:CheY-like chemotaxis protein
MQCPRCRNPITGAPDPGGFLICPGCGARLTTRPVRPRRSGNPDATLPPGSRATVPRPGEGTARAKAFAAAAASATAVTTPAPPAESGAPAGLEAVLAELRALRRGHNEALRLLRILAGVPPGESADDFEDDTPALLPPVRSRLRKSALIIDDDDNTREASLAELQAADVPVRGFADGRSALEAMAQERPNVIAIEIELGGALAGKDVINMIKSSMDWVDIPVILYTRAAVESQREARQMHGADDVVLKRSGPAALVSKVVALFRRP